MVLKVLMGIYVILCNVLIDATSRINVLILDRRPWLK